MRISRDCGWARVVDLASVIVQFPYLNHARASNHKQQLVPSFHFPLSQRHLSMISVPGREVLQVMKRVDIQKLCKVR